MIMKEAIYSSDNIGIDIFSVGKTSLFDYADAVMLLDEDSANLYVFRCSE